MQSEGTRGRRGEAGCNWRPHRPEDGQAHCPLQWSEEEVVVPSRAINKTDSPLGKGVRHQC